MVTGSHAYQSSGLYFPEASVRDKEGASVRLLDPHPGPLVRLQGQIGVHLGRGATDIQRLLHGLPEAGAVVFEGASVADLPPDPGLFPRLGFEAERPPQQGKALVDLVTADSQLRRPPRPRHCPSAQRVGLPFPARPG